MIRLYPPDDPFLINTAVFGIPLVIRWYGVFIVTGAMIAASLAARRGQKRGYHPDHAWNILMLGLVLGIIGARIYYVAFEWSRFGGNVWAMINITTGGLAIHGAIIGALIAVVLYTRQHTLLFWEWLDIYTPGFLLAQGIGRWGNFFNQEAYGRPTELSFGVKIAPQYRLPPYDNLERYPSDTLFHATFLYESTWNMIGFGLLLFLDQRWGSGAPPEQRRLHHGDLFFLYCVYYSLGRFWIEGLRTDSLYLGTLRMAQVVSLVLVAIGISAIVINHHRTRNG